MVRLVESHPVIETQPSRDQRVRLHGVGQRGLIEARRVAGRSVVTAARAGSPLKLLTPRRAGDAAWVYASTYGGGLLAGDCVDLQVRVGARASLVLGTQASTKVYRSPSGVAARQSLRASVEGGGLLVATPDPVSPFASSVYESRQRFDLTGDAALVLVDWVTCGRLAMGERWALQSYISRVEVFVDGRRVLLDALALSGMEDSELLALRVGGFNCLATVVLIGPRIAADASELIARVQAEPLERRAVLLGVASPLRGGAILRVGGPSVEAVGRYLQGKLRFLPSHLGDNPWARKW